MNSAQAGVSSHTLSLPKWGAGQYLRSAAAVLDKEIACELRSRHALSAVLLFAATSTVAASFAVGVWGARSAVAAALLWLVIYFSAMSGLGRTFVREEETFTAATLKLAARPNSVYLGKLAFNFGLLVAVEVVAVPLFVVLAGCRVEAWGGLIAVLILGSLGLSSAATIAAAMVARAATKGALLAVISFPLLIPVLAIAIRGSGAAMDGLASASDIRLLAYYSGAMITSSLMLFRFIWED